MSSNQLMRDFNPFKREQAGLMNKRNTELFVDINAIENNIGIIKKITSGKKICAVVKANAYGHGDVVVANTLLKNNIEWLAVSSIEEGISLREQGILNARILVMGGNYKDCLKEIIHYKLTPSLFSIDSLLSLAERLNEELLIHLKIDTGMSRLGVKLEDTSELIRIVNSHKSFKVEGVFTHLANADLSNNEKNRVQLETFEIVLAKLKQGGIIPSLIHTANSATILTLDQSYFDMVRPGLLIYGVSPFGNGDEIGLKMSMSWHTKPLQIKKVNKGERVSYEGSWQAEVDSLVAVLPVGYADGYHRLLSNNAFTLVKGMHAPVIGNVCMDHIIVDVTKIPDINCNDEFVLLGKQGEKEITFEQISEWFQTIPYEIMCAISSRVPRVYSN